MEGKRFTLEPGQFVLLDNTRFYQMEMETEHEVADLMMPQGWLEKYLPDPAVLLGRPLPDNRWQTRPVTVRIDQDPPFDAAGRNNDTFAMAVDRGNERSMTRFVQTVSNASEVQFTLQPLEQSPSVISFQVAGARDAIERVYKACKDDLPS